MDYLFENSKNLISEVNTDYIRPQSQEIDWSWRLNGIVGARGIGKTTLLLQHINQAHGLSSNAIYVTLDDIYFSENRLTDFIRSFRLKGGKYLYLDEVHKYPRWAQEIKNAHDSFKDLSIVFTGSSIIDILKQNVDLSRRAVIYDLPGLSFREYLNLSGIKDLPAVQISDLLANHEELSIEFTRDFRPLQFFGNYLRHGYYPFFLEGLTSFSRKLKQVINLIIETDLNFIESYDSRNARKISRLLYILSANVPFKPNISKLSEKIGIHRNTLLQYLHYLEKASIIHLINASGVSTSILQKPEKVYLRNPNLNYTLAPEVANIGTIRETFFISQLHHLGEVSIPLKGDFSFDNQYTFEIEGVTKKKTQIEGIDNAYLVVDDIERGTNNKVPLWMFGLLY